MRKLFIFTAICMAFSASAQIRKSPPVTAANRADWFKEAKFGMFVHWGLYSILGGTYNGRTLPDTTMKYGRSWYAEWIQQRLEVPEKEYRNLVKQFNPVNFDAEQWILEAKGAGMKYFVITSKHHDGFALWDSKVSVYDIGSTPFKRDVLGELAKACKKYGLKLGFYYSHWQDWEHPGGAWPSWTFYRPEAEFEKYWQQKCLPQVKELIERYDPDLLWFDTWEDKNHITDKRRDELIAMIRKLSPKCLINGRISYLNPGSNIDFLEMHDNQYPDGILEKPWQTPATMVRSWGWHSKDYNWKSGTEMLGYLIGNTAKGGNYLLNIGPKPDGSFPAAAIHRLRAMGGWLAANGEAIYGAKPVKKEVQEGVYLTQKSESTGQKAVYVHIVKPLQSNELILSFTASDIIECSLLETGMPIKFAAAENNMKLLLPGRISSMADGISVIKMTMKQ